MVHELSSVVIFSRLFVFSSSKRMLCASFSCCLSAMDARMWDSLLEIFRTSVSPVRAAVHWVESQGYGGALGTPATHGNARGVLQSLSRFVPELLAKTVVVIEEGDGVSSAAAASVSNCKWIQTLPTAMQTDILTFLTVEHSYFHSKDLCSLASALLATQDVDLWVMLAASNMLKMLQACVSEDPSYLEQKHLVAESPALKEYFGLPNWLEEYRGTQSLLSSGLPHVQIEVATNEAKEVQVNDQFSSQEGTDREPKSLQYEKGALTPSPSERKPEGALRKRKRGGTSPAIVQEEESSAHEPSVLLESPESLTDKEEKLAIEILGGNLFARAKGLGEALKAKTNLSGLPQDVEIIPTAPDLISIFKVIKPWLLDDETTGLLVGFLLGEQSGYLRSTQIITNVLLPKLMHIQEAPSRALGSAVLQAGRAHPRATVDALLLPLLLGKEGPSTAQCDIVNRVVKECPNPEVISSFCNSLFCPPIEDQMPPSLVWTEVTVGVMHNLLSQRIVLEENAVEGLVSMLERASNQFSTSLKFGNLLLNLVTKHGAKVRDHKVVLQQVAGNTATFLTKSVLSKLSSLSSG